MKKIMFIMGSIEVMLGVVLWSIADLLKNMMPVLGRTAFQLAMKGSFATGDYILFTTIPTILAIGLILAGIVQIFLSAKKEP